MCFCGPFEHLYSPAAELLASRVLKRILRALVRGESVSIWPSFDRRWWPCTGIGKRQTGLEFLIFIAKRLHLLLKIGHCSLVDIYISLCKCMKARMEVRPWTLAAESRRAALSNRRSRPATTLAGRALGALREPFLKRFKTCRQRNSTINPNTHF